MNGDIPLVNEESWEREVSNCPFLVLADFYSDDCGPCKSLEQELKALMAEYEGKVKFVRVNVDRDTNLAIRRGVISGIPRLQFIVEDRAVGEMQGNHSRKDVKETIDKYLENINSYV